MPYKEERLSVLGDVVENMHFSVEHVHDTSLSFPEQFLRLEILGNHPWIGQCRETFAAVHLRYHFGLIILFLSLTVNSAGFPFLSPCSSRPDCPNLLRRLARTCLKVSISSWENPDLISSLIFLIKSLARWLSSSP